MATHTLNGLSNSMEVGYYLGLVSCSQIQSEASVSTWLPRL